MEILWDLHFINGLFRPFQQSGYRAVPNGVTVIAQPAGIVCGDPPKMEKEVG